RPKKLWLPPSAHSRLLTKPTSAPCACSSVPAASNRAVYPRPLQQSGGRGLSNPSELPVGLTNHLRYPLLGKHQITDLLPVGAETGPQSCAFLQQLLSRGRHRQCGR